MSACGRAWTRGYLVHTVLVLWPVSVQMSIECKQKAQEKKEDKLESEFAVEVAALLAGGWVEEGNSFPYPAVNASRVIS